jgi:hypothetical protein
MTRDTAGTDCSIEERGAVGSGDLRKGHHNFVLCLGFLSESLHVLR